MGKNKKKVAEVINEEVTNEMVMENETVTNEMFAEGLESAEEEIVSEDNTPKYDDVDYLTKTTPFFPEEFTSKKCNLEREPNVFEGLKKIAEIDPTFPKLFRLLGAWWENKAARSEIKKMIDAEANSKGIDPVIYMQVNMKEFAEKYNGLSDAAKRLCYATTYFKPRGGIKEVTITKRMLLDGNIYIVPVAWLNEVREKLDNDRDAIREEVRNHCQIEAFEDSL